MLPSTLPRPKVSGALRGVVILLVLRLHQLHRSRESSIAAPAAQREIGNLGVANWESCCPLLLDLRRVPILAGWLVIALT